jgi:Fe2+ transport system protein FeoA
MRPVAGSLLMPHSNVWRVNVIDDATAVVPLSTLQTGAEASLHRTELDADTRSLLRSLGLIDASHLRVCKNGEPFIIQVRATRIGLTGAVAGRIFVVANGAPKSNGFHEPDRAGG